MNNLNLVWIVSIFAYMACFSVGILISFSISSFEISIQNVMWTKMFLNGSFHKLSLCQSVITVVSGWKAIVGLMHPVTIGIHISTEISKTSHPRDLKF